MYCLALRISLLLQYLQGNSDDNNTQYVKHNRQKHVENEAAKIP